MKTSVMALLLSLTVSGALLASAAQEAASSDEAAELVVWTHATITPERRVAWEADVKGAFQEAHPHVTINLEFIPETYDTAKTAIAGGGGPDITVMYGGHAMELAKAGLLYEMNDYVEQYGWDERFASWALPLWSWTATSIRCRTRSRPWCSTTAPRYSNGTAGRRPTRWTT